MLAKESVASCAVKLKTVHLELSWRVPQEGEQTEPYSRLQRSNTPVRWGADMMYTEAEAREPLRARRAR